MILENSNLGETSTKVLSLNLKYIPDLQDLNLGIYIYIYNIYSIQLLWKRGCKLSSRESKKYNKVRGTGYL